MAMRTRKFEHNVDSLAGCMILVHEADDSKVTHLILDVEDSKHTGERLTSIVNLLEDIIGAEADRRMYKKLRDDRYYKGEAWRKYNRKFKSATMRRYRSLNRALIWLAEED